MFKKLSLKIGFTETEIKVLLFLLAIFLAGLAYTKFIKGEDSTKYKEFDYSKEEASLLKSEQGDSVEEGLASEGKDSVRRQVLELKDRPYEVKSKKLPAEKSIDLNTASKEELMKISGIGEKTAENILSYREKTGKFKNTEELMNVKGIGEAKYAKFKKYLFVK
ncbi:MAG: helix-hairpin-helix domain-containing protein [Ignavibacteriaceae bacterium]|nr:helix-hairpin-helix domain-containing protein [Ignavibacteriaceae bacterium]